MAPPASITAETQSSCSCALASASGSGSKDSSSVSSTSSSKALTKDGESKAFCVPSEQSIRQQEVNDQDSKTSNASHKQPQIASPNFRLGYLSWTSVVVPLLMLLAGNLLATHSDFHVHTLVNKFQQYLSNTDVQKTDATNVFRFGMVSDLDKRSRDTQEMLWRSYFLRGVMVRKSNGNFTISWENTTELQSLTARSNRSMELSELVWLRCPKQQKNLLYTMCDYTGMILKIDPHSGTVVPRFAVSDGDGEKAKPFKIEWATQKDDLLYIGSIGKEWITETGEVLHNNAQWVKTLDCDGRIRNYDWKPVYDKLRAATGTSFPKGYLWHEAFEWNPHTREWIVLPRKASTDVPYDEKTDETKGSNILMVADEHFTNIKVSRIGPLDPEYGFTAVRRVPGTKDLFAALKVAELGHFTRTLITVFDLNGQFYTEGEDGSPYIRVADVKYEGLDFL